MGGLVLIPGLELGWSKVNLSPHLDPVTWEVSSLSQKSVYVMSTDSQLNLR